MDRTAEDVNATLKEAKIKLDELLHTHYSLHFSRNLSSSGMKLFEVPANVVEELERPQPLIIRGLLSDNAVCCLPDQTFSLRGADTSNTILLVNAIEFPDAENIDSDDSNINCHHSYFNIEVKQSATSYIDSVRMASQIIHLKDMLNAHPYHGSVHDISLSNAGCTTQELLDNIQSNYADLMKALDALNAIQIDDKWMIPHVEHFIAILESCSSSELTGNATLDQMVDRLSTQFSPKKFLRAMLSRLFPTVDCNFSLDIDFICKLYAIVLLSSVKSMKLKDFLDIWRNSVPADINPSLSCLEGIALIFDDSICYLDRFDFPEDFKERLDILFNIKSSLTLNEMRPFLIDAVIDEAEMTRVLSHTTHSYVCNGEKFYCKKV